MARFSPALGLALIACGIAYAQDVKTRYMPETDFSKYRTYTWVRIEGAGYPDQIIDTDIMRSIDSQLVAKGLTKVDSGTPDSAHAASSPQPASSPQAAALPQPPALAQPPALPQPPALAQPSGLTHTADSVQTNNSAPKADLLVAYHVGIDREKQWNGFGSFDRFPGGFGMGSGTATSSTIEIGTLVLEMYDPVTKKLVWSGSATKTLNISKDQQKNQKNVDKAMQKLLKAFPPTQK